MKNKVKNALNALGLLVFMILAWATKKEIPIQPIQMEVKINADSTAFLLKNLEETEFKNGRVSLTRISDRTRIDTVIALFFIKDSISINAKSTVVIPFNTLIGINNASKLDTFSKQLKPQRFVYSVFLPRQVEGLFDFDF